MAIPTRELVVQEPMALTTPANDGVALFERLARDPDTSVEKIERLMALWERGEARKAQTAFNVSMRDCQADMRPVSQDASNPQTKSHFASYHALDRALRPIYTKHGFGLSFDTEDGAAPETVRVICLVTHVAGFTRTYHIDMPADGKGAKGGDVMTKTHAVGSALTYGKRYLIKGIFNIAEGDDDGNRAGGYVEPTKPDGFEEWADDMTATAGEGVAALKAAWTAAKPEFRKAAGQARLDAWKALAAKARPHDAA